MGNNIRRQSVHPTVVSFATFSTQNYKIIVNHNALLLHPLDPESGETRFDYELLNVASWRSALRQAMEFIGDGRIVSLAFNAFLQVPSLADLQVLLPAIRHVRSLDLYPGNTDDGIAKWENYNALAQFVETFEDLKELVGFFAKDFDWTRLNAGVLKNLRRLWIDAIGDGPVKPVYRQMLQERILAFCADAHVVNAGGNVTVWLTGWDFGSKFILRLAKIIQESKFIIEVEVQVRDEPKKPFIKGFVRAKNIRGMFSVSLSEDTVEIKRIRG